jgi:hypothetical protein
MTSIVFDFADIKRRVDRKPEPVAAIDVSEPASGFQHAPAFIPPWGSLTTSPQTIKDLYEAAKRQGEQKSIGDMPIAGSAKPWAIYGDKVYYVGPHDVKVFRAWGNDQSVVALRAELDKTEALIATASLNLES